jgi:hypothetical protein
MGFFNKIKDFSDPTAALDPFGLTGNPIQDEQRERAEDTVKQGQAAVDLKREQFETLREDAEPLRELRNENINRLLNLQGADGERDLTAFNASPEFTSVRDAAAGVGGLNDRQDIELQERAQRLGEGEFANFRNRIFNTAGFSSTGLNNTNRLLQQNVDAQANLLNNAGATAASGLISGAEARGQGASAIGGLVGMFCDKRLKDNAVQIGTYDIGIPKYEWEWSEKALALVGDQPTTGPMAHEVQAIMPDNVHTVDGYLRIKDMRLIH